MEILRSRPARGVGLVFVEDAGEELALPHDDRVLLGPLFGGVLGPLRGVAVAKNVVDFDIFPDLGGTEWSSEIAPVI